MQLVNMPSVCTGLILKGLTGIKPGALRKFLITSFEDQWWNPWEGMGLLVAVTTTNQKRAIQQLTDLGFTRSENTFPSKRHYTRTILWYKGIQQLVKELKDEVQL